MIRANVLVLAACAALNAAGLSAGDPVLDEIAADWTKRQKIARSVRYQVEGTHLRPQGSLNELREEPDFRTEEDLPSEDRISPYKFLLVVHFDADKNWMRVEREREILNPGPEFIRELAVDLADGKEFQRFVPLDRNPRIEELERAGGRLHFELMQLSRSSAAGTFREFTERPLYWAHGLVPTPGPLEAIRQPVDLKGYRVAGRVQHDGRECLVLHSPARSRGKVYSELWIDPLQDSAIVRFSDVREGEESLIFLVSHRQTSHGWFPSDWTVEHRSSVKKGLLLDRSELRVTEFEFDPQLKRSDFHVEPTPGMYYKDVRDRRKAAKYVHVGSGQSPLEAMTEWRRRNRPTEVPNSPLSQILVWSGIGCLGVALLVLGLKKYLAS